jgi:HEAT repeat protein
MVAFTNLEQAVKFLHENLQPIDPTSDFPDAAGYLGKTGDERALAPLLEALKFGNAYIRAVASSGLGYFGRQEAVPHLIEAFTNDPGVYVRCDAALALGRLGSEESLPVLLARFPIDDFEVQKRIVMAIGEIGTEAAREALVTIKSFLDTIETPLGGEEFLAFLVEEGLSEDTNH